jgi:hypothetical protein
MMLTTSTGANKFTLIDEANIFTLLGPKYTIANTDNPNSYLYRIGLESNIAEVNITNTIVTSCITSSS